jgi:hypothetical protein
VTVAIDKREIETIQIFVSPTKRERYISFLSNEKRRKEFASNLAHFNDFDPRRIVRIPNSSQTAAGIRKMLKTRGAEDTCHAISELKDLDGKDMDLMTALEKVIGRGMGTLLCCSPIGLAYFENEDDRFILENVAPTRQEQA